MTPLIKSSCVWIAEKAGWLNDVKPSVVRRFQEESQVTRIEQITLTRHATLLQQLQQLSDRSEALLNRVEQTLELSKHGPVLFGERNVQAQLADYPARLAETALRSEGLVGQMETLCDRMNKAISQTDQVRDECLATLDRIDTVYQESKFRMSEASRSWKAFLEMSREQRREAEELLTTLREAADQELTRFYENVNEAEASYNDSFLN